MSVKNLRKILTVLFITSPLVILLLFSQDVQKVIKRAILLNFNFLRTNDKNLFYRRYIRDDNILTITNPFNKQYTININTYFNEYNFQNKFNLKYSQQFNALFLYENCETNYPTTIKILKDTVDLENDLNVLKEYDNIPNPYNDIKSNLSFLYLLYEGHLDYFEILFYKNCTLVVFDDMELMLLKGCNPLYHMLAFVNPLNPNANRKEGINDNFKSKNIDKTNSQKNSSLENNKEEPFYALRLDENLMFSKKYTKTTVSDLYGRTLNMEHHNIVRNFLIFSKRNYNENIKQVFQNLNWTKGITEINYEDANGDILNKWALLLINVTYKRYKEMEAEEKLKELNLE